MARLDIALYRNHPETRYEDWQWEYQSGSNPRSFLGNGFSLAEGHDGELGWYISSWDGSPIDPCLKPEEKV